MEKAIHSSARKGSIKETSILMSEEIKFKKFQLVGLNGNELGTVSIEHLWADVFALKIKIHSVDGLCDLEKSIQEALDVAKRNRARIVMYRLIKGETASQEIGHLLLSFGFKKKNEQIEFKKSVSELSNDEGSPLKWKTANELNLNPEGIAKILVQVSMSDPDTDPTDDPLQFIHDFLTDPVLTSGLECIHVGFFQEEVAALTVVQRNPKTGWSRISYMGVVPRFRKQNLGNWVHRYSFTVMKKEGGLLYHGGTTSTNLGMIRLFESNGCARFCEMVEWNFSVGSKVTG